MHRIIAILLLLSLSFQSLVKLGIVAWYQVNKTYVATTLCENKSKPSMKCNGKCYLKKQLAKAKDTNNKQSHKQADTKIETVEFLVTANQSIPVHFDEPCIVMNGHYAPFTTSNALSDIFHPPSLCT